MDKKNTMLLTVIAVATLLVAVVGATFAYFSVTTPLGSDVTTTVSGKTEAVGTVALSNPTANLYLRVNAQEMSDAAKGTSYYATSNAIAAENDATTLSHHDADATPRAIATATVTGGSSTAKYHCSFTLTVDTTGTDATLAAGELQAVFTGLANKTVDLASYTGESIEFDLTGTGASSSLNAVVKLNNLATQQNAANLSGKTLAVTFTNSDWTCDTVAAG